MTAQKPKLTPRPAPINPLPAEPPAELLSSTEPSAESLELESLAKSLAKLLPSTEPSAETPAEPLELEPPTEPPAGLHPLEPAPAKAATRPPQLPLISASKKASLISRFGA